MSKLAQPHIVHSQDILQGTHRPLQAMDLSFDVTETKVVVLHSMDFWLTKQIPFTSSELACACMFSSAS